MGKTPKKLSDVIGLDFFFLLGQSDTCIFACLDTLQQPSHISPDGAHVLHSFQILLDLIRRIAMHLIQYVPETTGILLMVKYLFSWSKVAVAPPLRQETTAAPNLLAKAPLDITNNLSYAQEACPAAEA